MKSVMSHMFSQIPQADIQRSSFNRSSGYKSTFDAGYLIPFFFDEVLPGDTFNLKTSALVRLNTPIFPIMDNMFCDTFFFEIPNRLIWSNWQKFMGEQDNPGDSTDFTVPTIDLSTNLSFAEGSLFDYLAMPTQVNLDSGNGNLEPNALFSRAYNLVWNQWFRDENMQDSVVVDTGNGPDNPDDYVLLKRGKRHDYFTSCLPWPQKGTAVDIPIGTTAPVVRTSPYTPKFETPTSAPGSGVLQTNGSNMLVVTFAETSGDSLYWGSSAGDIALEADLSSATAATINQLRQAFQIQKLMERDARGGSRYTEIIRAHFGVVSPDARLQRTEYLGGGSTPIIINPVAQTSVTATTPQGNLAAVGHGHINGHGFTKSFTEHGVILGLICVRADLTYQQGMPRMYRRSTKYDYYWPALANIGEQAVNTSEIYASANAVTNATVFGYQERFAEMRYRPSYITGTMRSNATGSLDAWHLSQEFGAAPTLGDTFIKETPPMDRVVAVTSQPDFYLDAYFDLHCARPMPLYGVPGQIDRF